MNNQIFLEVYGKEKEGVSFKSNYKPVFFVNVYEISALKRHSDKNYQVSFIKRMEFQELNYEYYCDINEATRSLVFLPTGESK